MTGKNCALFIFRRDLRIADNTGLLFAVQNFQKVLTSFIFTPEQVDNSNEFRSDRCLQFMLDCLEDLSADISKNGGKLNLFYGNVGEIVRKLIEDQKVNAIIVNRDFTQFSIERDKIIEKVCLENLIEFKSFDDLLLNAPETTLKPNTKEPYTVFTPFYKNASNFKVPEPVDNVKFGNFSSEKIKFAIDDEKEFFAKLIPKRFEQAKGGRQECLKTLADMSKFKKYSEDRDFLAKQGTTRLSAHLKFTTCSPREIYYAATKQLGSNAAPLTRQLYWRDFYTQIALFFPKVFRENFREKYNKLLWGDDEHFKLWCEGKTGFPIVDAGMRELNETGYMHNRARMITASFLVKDLHIDWRLGEKYFARHLIDYDPCVNNGNWQWAASTGCDPQPYFRIFNPWLQSAKFDPDCEYIKRYVSELKDVAPPKIHKWYMEENRKNFKAYPAPIVDHWKESKNAIERFKAC
uniref:Cryptochrome-1 n=1 Tax=Romanomermis culicivorax TaxID=13658 RepID=A0A915JW93_ROMCU